ncbi:unnamed protein product [Gordionus sp. m RMFG-2023]|uniref:checkpoint protein HUS1-like n=1 Tax=Gordionus sp. m RMFG-2023 TaxID=3053472 RepID=UPI0030E2EA79
MRLRVKITEQSSISNFSKIFQNLSRLGKLCVIRFTDKLVYILYIDEIINGGNWGFCKIYQERIFEEYCMEGLDKETNEIYMEVLIENIMKALKNAASTKLIKIKLTKKKGPTLTFELETSSMLSSTRSIIHDIPINLISKKFWPDFQAPDVLPFDISIRLPHLRVLKNMFDRIKQRASQIIITGNGKGRLSFKMETDIVTLNTRFKDSIFAFESDFPAIYDNSCTSFTQKMDNLYTVGCDKHLRTPASIDQSDKIVKVDLKKISAIFTSYPFTPERACINIKDRRSIQIFLVRDDFEFQYILPCFAEVT